MEAAKLFIQVTGDISEAQRSFTQIEHDVENAGKKAEAAGGGFTKMGAMATGAVAGIAAGLTQMATGFIMQAPAAILGKLGDAIDLASDKAESASKNAILFGASVKIIDDASTHANTTMGVSSGKYDQLAGDLGNLVTNFGFAGDEAANMTVDMVQLAADMGSFNNASTEDVTYAMGAAFRGETEPIRKYGVMLDAASVSAKAVEMGLIPVGGVLDKTSKLTATYALILDQTTSAQGDFARTSEGYANSQKINNAKVEEAWIRVGEAIKPIAQILSGLLAEAMTGAINLVMNIADQIGAWIDDNKDLLDAIGSLVTNGIDLAIKAFGTLFDVTKKVLELAFGPLLPLTAALAAVMLVQLIPAVVGAGVAFGTKLLGPVTKVAGFMKDSLIPSFGKSGAGLDEMNNSTGKLGSAMKYLGPAMVGAAVAMVAIDIATTKTREAADALIQSLENMTEAERKAALEQKTFGMNAKEMTTHMANLFDIVGVFIPGINGTTTGLHGLVTALGDTGHAADDTRESMSSAGQGAIVMSDNVLLLNGVARTGATDLGTLDTAIEGVNNRASMAPEAFTEMQKNISGALTGLGLDFDMTDANMQALALRFGTDTETIKGEWDGVSATFQAQTEQIKGYLGQLPPDFVMTSDKAQAMARLLGVSADDITREFDAMRGLVSEDVRLMGDAVVGALEGMVGGSDTAWDAWKNGAKDGAESVQERIETLNARLTKLNDVDLAKLGPAATARWGAAVLATKTELGEMQSYVTNVAPTIAETLPTAIQNSVDENVAAWNKVVGVGESITGDMKDNASGWGDSIARSFVNGLVGELGSGATKQQIAGAIRSSMGQLHSESPPKEGPLHFIDRWGLNMGKTWFDGIIHSIKHGDLDPALSAVADDLRSFTASGQPLFSSPVLTDMAMPTRIFPKGPPEQPAQPGGPTRREGDIIVHAYGHTPDDVERQILRARRKQALADMLAPTPRYNE